MKRIRNGLSAVAGSLLLTAVASAATLPTPRPVPASVAAAARRTAPVQSAEASPDDPELKRLLDRLGALSDVVGKNATAPDAWRSLMEQGDLLMQLAARSKGAERENWLRMSIDSYYSAAIQSDAKDATAYSTLSQLPVRVAHEFPASHLASYAGMQVVQADYVRAVAADPEHPDNARAILHDRLLTFARDYPDVAGSSQGRDGRGSDQRIAGQNRKRPRLLSLCSRQLCRESRGAQSGRLSCSDRIGRRGGASGVAASFRRGKPQRQRLRPQGSARQTHSRLLLVDASPQAAEDLQILKDLAVKYHDRDFEVVYVNMDEKVSQARTFLAGRLTMGTHVYQSGGLDGAVAERYGIQALPTLFLLGKDGSLIKQSLPTSGLEAEVAKAYRGKVSDLHTSLQRKRESLPNYLACV